MRDPGEYEDAVTFLTETVGADDSQGGRPQSTWVPDPDRTDVFARVRTLDGAAKLRFGVKRNRNVVAIYVLYDPGITTALRLDWEGAEYTIEEALNLGMADEELKLMCVEKTRG